MRLHPSFSLLATLGCVFDTVNAIYASQAGHIDWQHQYVGIPILNSHALLPRMHRMGGSQPGQPAQAVVLAATMKNILAAINPSEGNIVWRRKYEDDDNLISFKGNQDGMATLSGRGGATARMFEVINGNLIWEATLHDPTSGHLSRLHSWEPSGAALEFDTIDMFVLSAGCTIRRLNGLNGETLWSWTHKDLATKVFLTHLVRTDDALYAIGISRGIMDLSIQVTSLNPETGEWLNAVEVPASITSVDDYIPLKVGANSKGGVARTAGLAWLEGGAIKQVLFTKALDSKHLAKPAANKYGPYSALRVPELGEKGYVVALLKVDKKDNKPKDADAHIFKMDSNGIGINKIGDFAAATSTTPHATFSGGVDRYGEAFISKIAYAGDARSASYQVFAPAALNGLGMTSGFSFDYDPVLHGTIDHVILDVAKTGEYSYASRFILTTGSGSIQKWQQETLGWVREESLTEIQAIAALDLPELASDSHRNIDETAKERILRQLGNIKDLPLFIFHFVQRFATGTYSIPAAAHSDGDGLWRDTYGFKKVIVAATSTGKLLGIETSKGETLWNVRLGTGDVGVGMKIRPVRMVALKTVSDGFDPEAGLVVEVEQDKGDGERVITTGMVRIDVLTGVTHSSVMFKGPLVEAFEVDIPTSIETPEGLGRKLIGMLDQDRKVYVFPIRQDAVELFNNLTTISSFALTTGEANHRSLQGFGLSRSKNTPIPDDVDPTTYDGPMPTWIPHTTWRSSFPAGESVVSVTKRTPGTAASHGRVTGDRHTLYKYLNPHLVAVVTQSQKHCTIYLLDSSKGTVLHSSIVKSGVNRPECDVKVSLVENWLVYHYYDPNEGENSSIGTKGWRIVSVELYEGVENVKSKSGELPADAAKRGSVSVVEQSYIFPYGIKTLTATSTKFGISSKDIVVINEKNQVQTFGRRFLDPRRPKNKPTAAESEEGLIQYDVLLPDDPRRVVSHHYNIIADQLLTTPTYLESTSLVFAYGCDIFLTRVAPSGTFDVLSENFNKIQLVLTVLALVVSIMITRPLVKQKIQKGKWFS